MKIYFAASIRGGRDDAAVYKEIIDKLKTLGDVLTEHFGDQTITAHEGTGGDDEDIYRKDTDWIREADVVVAEVTQPSLGVGYEIGLAEHLGKKIVCLFRQNSERTLSAMISGNPYRHLTVILYTDATHALTQLSKILQTPI